MGLAADIYAEELSGSRHGLPLWSPEPADEYEARIGDVGYIDEDGQFHRLFNVTVGPDHPYNAGGVPPDFEPLQFPLKLINVRDPLFSPSALISKNVTSHETSASASV